MSLSVQSSLRPLKRLLLVYCCCLLGHAAANEWNGPAQELARRIVAVTGPGAVTLTVENRSSLSKKEVDVTSGALRLELESLGARPVTADQAAASVKVSLSENPNLYIWVAEIHQGAGESRVVMVSLPRGDADLAHQPMPMNIRKIPLWTQEERILDIAILEEDSAPRQMAVLDGDKVAIYRIKNGKWQQEQSLPILHRRPWPRDLRGRILIAKDHLLDVYLPGVFCRSTTGLPLTLNCRESDDPWPLTTSGGASFPPTGGAVIPQLLGGFYSSSRNFFTGALAPGVGKMTTVGKFYSAAPLQREKYLLWLFAGTDGQTHFVDGMTDQTAKLPWGSEMASVKSTCGSGWQVLATGAADDGTDTVRAYEFADRDPSPVSAALDSSGEITALWTEEKGESAIEVVRNREAGDYEAYRLGVACNQ